MPALYQRIEMSTDCSFYFPFHFQFVAVRWSFLMSMFCFLGMITSRVLIEFDLLKEEACNSKTKRDVATLVVLSVGALASQLLRSVSTFFFA
jgi:hypothetical protein